jgi:heterodisulfide reductase subunit B2
VKVSYYPGCALHGTAIEYDESTKAVSRLLGVELCELPDWNCCGASSAHGRDDALAHNLVARNLGIAARQGMDVVIPCAACYGRFKTAEEESGDAVKSGRSRNFLILNLLEFFVSSPLWEKMPALKKRPLAGLKVVCYYGCLLVRPPRIVGTANPENPDMLDRLMTLLGADSIPWSYKTDCCGGSLALTRKDIVLHLTQRLCDQAIQAGAEAVVVACPLCQANLDTRQEKISQGSGEKYELPILYFTELMGVAFGHPQAPKWLQRHFINPTPLLLAKGLL